ncbi:MAG: hypothetical protein ACC645_17560 [Pirellulales bacterium]
MTEKKRPGSGEDADIERDIRADRKFNLAAAIGQLGGGDLMKGASPVTGKRQAELEIERYLRKHLVDAEGALLVVLLRRVRESAILMKSYDQPHDALARYTERLLDSAARLQRFVNEVDTEWGRIYYERPHFQKEDQPPHQDDPYTFSSVRATLSQLIEELRGA